MHTPPEADLRATIARLFVYPVKSCAGVELQQALLTETGLDLDRAWMLVDPDGQFLTQRTLPRMALIRPQIKSEEMVLRAPGMLALHVALEAVEAPARVRVWGDTVPAWDMGAVAAQWFSDFLGQRCRLVRFDPEHRRLSEMAWTGGLEAPNQFADAFPLLVLGSASLAELNTRLVAAGGAAIGVERFRPNLVLAGLAAHDEDRIDMLRIAGDDGAGDEDGGDGAIELQPVKPCARCSIPDVDPATAETGELVGRTLRSYRQDSRLAGAISFGMNAIVRRGAGRMLRVGQAVSGNLQFD